MRGVIKEVLEGRGKFNAEMTYTRINVLVNSINWEAQEEIKEEQTDSISFNTNVKITAFPGALRDATIVREG